jgi:hypothetical protein
MKFSIGSVKKVARGVAGGKYSDKKIVSYANKAAKPYRREVESNVNKRVVAPVRHDIRQTKSGGGMAEERKAWQKFGRKFK